MCPSDGHLRTSNQEPPVLSLQRVNTYKSFLLPRPGTSGLSTKWEITKRYAHL